MKFYCTRFLLLLATFALALSFPAWASDLPDHVLTPGAINPNVTQANIQQTVCVKGFTKKIRPPASYTNNIKRQQLETYYKGQGEMSSVEEDHLVPLIAGGHPTAIENLWPEPRISEWNADKKDRLEFVLYKMVCTQEISLAEAQHAMATNWIDAWQQYVPSHQHYRFKKRVD